MDKFLHKFVIRNACSGLHEELLNCTAVLRTIEGKRIVCDAIWGQKNVIVKLFTIKIISSYYAKKEWKSLCLLFKKGIDAPKPLFYGPGKDGGWAVVTEKIMNSQSALEVFKKASDESARLNLLIAICRKLAELNKAGVMQEDFHFENFLVTSGRVFVVDSARMRFFREELSRAKSISQIGSLLLCIPSEEASLKRKLLCEYAKIRGWEFNQADEQCLQRAMYLSTRGNIHMIAKKCLRTNKRDFFLKSSDCIGVAKKEFLGSIDADGFLERIDKMHQDGRILKDSNTSFVSVINWDGREVVVKKYNHKGLFHSLRTTIKGSRAKKSWQNSHILKEIKIPVPKPFAYIVRRRNGVVWESYFISEFVNGKNLYDFMRDKNITDTQKDEMVGQIMVMLKQMGKYNIGHSDLKHSNILIIGGKPLLIDIDAVRVFKWRWLYSIRARKYLSSFNNRLRIL